jgi:hypothetical protein
MTSILTWKEAPGDEIPRPLTVRVTGGIRTHNHFLRQRKALSVELQPHVAGG